MTKFFCEFSSLTSEAVTPLACRAMPLPLGQPPSVTPHNTRLSCSLRAR